MTRYLMRPDKKAKELIYALDNYYCDKMVVSAFSLGKRKGMDFIGGYVNNDLELKVSKVWEFYIDKKELITITPDTDQLFKLEYQDEKLFRIRPYYDDPNDYGLDGLVKYSVFRNVVDDYLLEIWFKGKIPLEQDIYKNRDDYWKIKK